MSRSARLPASTVFEVAAASSAWCADVAGAFQLAKYRGLKDLLLLHVVPKILMKRKDALVVSALNRESEDPVSFPSSATDLPCPLGGVAWFP